MIYRITCALVLLWSITVAGCVATVEDDYGFPEDLWEKIDNQAQGGS